MKGVLGFFGMFLSLLSDASFAADFVPTLACVNRSAKCQLFCDVCEEWGLPRMDCYSTLFKGICYDTFRNGMMKINSTDWCIWKKVRSLYNNFTLCTEEIAECLRIPWPNPIVEETFVEIHSEYFLDCPSEELTDPPPGVVFALVMTPICLIPVMVFLVVLKTKNGDGSS